MLHVTLKHLWAHKIRLFITSFAVMLGVAFVAGSLILGSTINRTFDDLFATAYKNTDAVVRGQLLFSGNESGDVRSQLDDSLLQTVAAVPGVRAVEPDILGFAQIVGKDGKPIGTFGPPQVGGPWWNDAELNAFKVDAGRAPVAADEVVIDRTSADKAKLQVGDTFTVLTKSAPTQFKLVGIVKFGEGDSLAGASFVLFNNLATAQTYSGVPGKIDTINVAAAEGVTQEEIKDRIAKVIPSGAETITGKVITEETQKQLKDDLGFLSIFLLIFAAISLFVAAFIIYNVFSILVAQRTREMALLRAIGARRRQVLNSVMVESVVVGLISSISGFFLGILVCLGLKAGMEAIDIEIASGGLAIPQSAFVVSLIVGTIITVLSAFLPARRASKIPPIAALREVAIDRTGRSRVRVVLGLITLTLGTGLLVTGLTVEMNKPYISVGIGAALIFVGFIITGPVIVGPVSRVIGAPLPKMRGIAGRLARDNAMRNPRRTSSTAAALMIGVMVVAAASVFFTSAKVSIAKSIDQSFTGDFVVQGPNPFMGGLSPTLAEELSKRPELETVSPVRWFSAQVGAEPRWITAIDPKTFTSIVDAKVSEGSLQNLGLDQIGVYKDTAENNDLTIGKSVEVVFSSGVQKSLKVTAIYDEDDAVGPFVVSLATSGAYVPQQFDQMIMINKAEGISEKTAAGVVEEVAAPYANADVTDQQEYKEQIASQVDAFLNTVYVLLALAIVIALLGIATTISLSVFERTREIGLLRAVGMTRRQIRSVVRWESIIVALFGTLMGLALGLIFGWALQVASSGEGITVLSIPWGRLVAITVIAGFAGVLAAIWPARKAARLKVLEAIATE